MATPSWYLLTSPISIGSNCSRSQQSLYLRPVPGSVASRHPPIEASIHQIMKEVSLLYTIPTNQFQAHFASGRLSLQETIYAHCVWVYVGHFLNRLGRSGSQAYDMYSS